MTLLRVRIFRTKESAGGGIPDITVAAVHLTETNLDAVGAWCGGHLSDNAVMVPTFKVEGDPNQHYTEGQGSKKRVWRELAKVEAKVSARPGSYVVRWNDLFFVVGAEAFESAYDEVL